MRGPTRPARRAVVVTLLRPCPRVTGALSREELVGELRRLCPGRFDAADGAELRLLWRCGSKKRRQWIAAGELFAPLI